MTYLRVLIIEDSEDDTFLILRELQKSSFDIDHKRIDNKGNLLSELSKNKWDVIISDYMMPRLHGMDVINILKEKQSDIPLIIVSGVIGESTAVEAMKAGAHDYLMKDNLHRLVPAIERELREYKIRLERKNAKLSLEKHVLELARSNAELKQFADVASHDLKEPLRMITSYAQLLQKRYKKNLDSNANEFIKFIVDSAIHMKKLIDGLLAYSRIGNKEKPFKKFDLNHAVVQAIINLKQTIDENKASVTYKKLPLISGDMSQITQLFQNLIGNGIKFKKNLQPDININCSENIDAWLFSVEDNGIGIKKQYYKQIFNIFQRLHTKEEYPGTGIGLAICKKIVQNHNGDIWIESKFGKGSKFYFTISKDRNIK